MEANQRVGRLTLLEKIHQGKSPRWRCRCDCGTVKPVLENSLQQGLTRSCGCLRKEIKNRTMALAFPRQEVMA